MTRLIARTAFALCIAVTASQASASVLFTFAQVGSDVELTGVGKLSLGGPAAGRFTLTPDVQPQFTSLLIGTIGQAVSLYKLDDVQGDHSFGAGLDTHFASSGTGDTFGFIGSSAYLLLPVGYRSNASLSGESLYFGETFTSLGLTPGTYDYSYDVGEVSDEIHVQVGPTAVGAVPEPASLALSGIGLLAGIGAAGRRKRLSSDRSNGR